MLRRPSPSAAAAVCCLAAVCVGCAPFDLDSGTAEVEIQRGDEEVLVLIHDPTKSQVALTPPVDGEVELAFTYQDPLVSVILRVNGNQVASGERVDLPADANTLLLSVVFDDAEFVSTAGASGSVDVETLVIEEEAGSAELRASFDATLVATDPQSDETVQVRGFVEGSVGDPLSGEGAEAEDAGVTVVDAG